MRQFIDELVRIRRLSRALLFTQRLLQWLAACVVLLASLALLDYALRLPGHLRLVLGPLAALATVGWLVSRLYRASRFRPTLSTLALRAERAWPALRGQLASGVELAQSAAADRSPLSASLAQLSVVSAQTLAAKATGGSLLRLVDPSLTLRHFLAAGLLLAGLWATVALAPHTSLLAARRWLDPLGPTQWPRHTALQLDPVPEVWPADTPLPLRLSVVRGYRAGLRATVRYRVLSASGPTPAWRSALLSEQPPLATDRGRLGRYETLLDVTDPAETDASAQVEFTLAAGDDALTPKRVLLVQRPALTRLTTTLTPPLYAQPFLPPVNLVLGKQAGTMDALSALRGSTVRLEMAFNKPLPPGSLSPFLLAPGLAEAPGLTIEAQPSGAVLAFTLDQSRRTVLSLTDEHGLSGLGDRPYAFEAVEDRPPEASLLLPAADESVLPTAVVPLQGAGRDDVAVERLELAAAVHRAAAAEPDSPQPLSSRAQKAAESQLSHELDLASMSLTAGDCVLLTAVATDVFELDGLRHDPVRSTPRVLRIIDASELVSQLRGELSSLRQQAVRLAERQNQLLDLPAEQALGPQQQTTQQLQAQGQWVKSLQGRVQRNGLGHQDDGLSQTLQRAGSILEEAQGHSTSAQQRMKPESSAAREEARADQQRVGQAMGKLVELLDQGRDAAALELQLRHLAASQESLLAQSRQLAPRTVGQDPGQLSPEDRAALEALRDRQAALSDQSQAMVQRMQSTAEALSKQEDSPGAQDQASAAALSQAAAIAQRQGLSASMRQASASLGQNQMSQASTQQQQSLDTARQMLDALRERERRRQEILQRRLAELAQAIQTLIDQQEQESAALEQAGDAGEVAQLEPGQGRVRRNTQSVSETARKADPPVGGPPGQGKAGDELDAAAESQGRALTSLRSSDSDQAAQAQEQAAASLRDALQTVRQAQRDSEREQARQERQELREKYEKLALWQGELITQTRTLGDESAKAAAPLPRALRARVVTQGQTQEDLRLAIAELGEQAKLKGGGVVFEHTHRTLDQTAARAVTRLRAGHADDFALDAQASVERLLRQIAAVLAEEDAEDSEFDDNASGGGGEGGGGGAGGVKLIPPVAELKLLRGAQVAVNEATRRAAAQPVGDAADQRRDLLRLSTWQRELAGVGERLIQSLQPEEP